MQNLKSSIKLPNSIEVKNANPENCFKDVNTSVYLFINCKTFQVPSFDGRKLSNTIINKLERNENLSFNLILSA